VADTCEKPPVIPVVTALELDTKVAQYRTAIVTLMDLIQRNAPGYMSWEDQNLMKQIARLIDEDSTR
jgi:hypothetical protein